MQLISKITLGIFVFNKRWTTKQLLHAASCNIGKYFPWETWKVFPILHSAPWDNSYIWTRIPLLICALQEEFWRLVLQAIFQFFLLMNYLQMTWKKKNTFLTFIFDFNDKVVIPLYLLQYWKIFSLFLIFLKYERLGKYFPHCTQHREIATTYEQKFLCWFEHYNRNIEGWCCRPFPSFSC